MKKCPVCQTLNEDLNHKCPSCNYQFTADQVIASVYCTSCGTASAVGKGFCRKCGKPLITPSHTSINQPQSIQPVNKKKHNRYLIAALCVIMSAVLVFALIMIISIAGYLKEAKEAQASVGVHNSEINKLSEADDQEISAAAAQTTQAPVETTKYIAQKTYAIIVKNAGNPYNMKEAEGFQKVIEEAGGTCIIKAPSEATAEEQIIMINELVAQKVDAIAIASNDSDALQQALKQAMDAGIKVLSFDSAVNKDSRLVHVNQAGTLLIGTTLAEAVADIAGPDGGQFAILSATSQATNQNAWIEAMKAALAKDSHNLELVKIAYGDDEFQKSVDETETLINTYPDLKVICAPTTVGMMAAGKVLTDKGLTATIKLTGLGLPSEMADYIGADKACPYIFLWNPLEIGALAAHTAIALVEGTITGKAGETFTAGTLGDKKDGKYTIVAAADGGTEIILGSPFKFDPSNIAEWKTVY